MKDLNIQEAAARWGVSPRRIQQMCKEGRIAGARKEGRAWLIPEEAEIHVRSRFTENLITYDRAGYAGNAGNSGYTGNIWSAGYAEWSPPDRAGFAEGPRLLPLPVGISGYIEAVSRYYYIDKTLLIRDFIDAMPKVSLFTRPRRFGKTLNMDMLRVFFERSKTDTSVYFKDKAIWACGEYYRSFQGRYPVINLSFKDVKYKTWVNARKDLAEIIRSEFARHGELAGSSACNPVEKRAYQAIISEQADEVTLSRSLGLLSAMLHKHYGIGAVIIIDEYDTPVQQGYINGYYEQVIDFIRNLFSGAFKDNPDLAYGFLTGILRVAKESIFSGLNNLKVNTIMDERYSGYFGFSREEVKKMLSYYGREDKMEEVCEWYDGYQFGNTDIFNPWSVINYVDENCCPRAFWQSTGSNEIIGDIIASASPDVTANLRRLMQGEILSAYVDTSVIYPEVNRNPSSIYSFLLITGYLRCTDIQQQYDSNFMCRISIPNREIAFVYAREIISRLLPEYGETTAAAIHQAVFEKDTEGLRQVIQAYLTETISAFDSGSEAFYQGLIIGFCAILNNRYTVRSNRESGLGRFDIQLFPTDNGLPGFIFELKASHRSNENLDKLAASALQQIQEKKYETEMRSAGVREVIRLGIAFRGKEICIRQGKE